MSDQITSTLKSLNGNIPEIIGGAVISIDGQLIASAMPGKIDEDLLGGMAAAMLGIGERISSELMRSDMGQVYIRSPDGYVLVNAVGSDASLVVLVAKQAKLGLIFLEVKRTIQDLERLLCAS